MYSVVSSKVLGRYFFFFEFGLIIIFKWKKIIKNIIILFYLSVFINENVY